MSYSIGRSPDSWYNPYCNNAHDNPGCVPCNSEDMTGIENSLNFPLCFLEGEMAYCHERYKALTNGSSNTEAFFSNSAVEVFQTADDLSKKDGLHFNISGASGGPQNFFVPMLELDQNTALISNFSSLYIRIGEVYLSDLDMDGDEDLVLVFGDRNDIVDTAIVMLFLYNDEVDSGSSGQFVSITDYEAAGNECSILLPVVDVSESTESDIGEEPVPDNSAGGCGIGKGSIETDPATSVIMLMIDAIKDLFRPVGGSTKEVGPDIMIGPVL